MVACFQHKSDCKMTDLDPQWASRHPMTRVVTILILASMVIQGLGEPARRLLRYDRTEVMSGEVWRLFSGHFVHLGWMHLGLNAAALCLMALLFKGPGPGTLHWPGVALASSLGVGLGLLWLDPTLHWYVGLSGTAHGLAAAACLNWSRQHRGTGLAYLTLLAGKLAWEQWHGASAASAALIGGATIVNAHLYGAIAGSLAALMMPMVTPRDR